MAVKNLQVLVQCVANIQGVVVTGMRKESKRATGSIPATFPSLASLRLEGPNPFGTDPDNGSFLRAGRSARVRRRPCARTPAVSRERKRCPRRRL